jgi:hypothetical protein
MDLQKIFIENESIAPKLVREINEALEKRGLKAWVDSNGHTHYEETETEDLRDAVYSATHSTIREYDLV